MKTIRRGISALAALFIVCPSLAVAQVVCPGSPCDVDVSGVPVNAPEGDPLNEIIDVSFGGAATITGLGWDVTIEAFSPSWLSEVTVGFAADIGVNELYLTPGVGDDFSGVGGYSSGGIINLSDLGIPDIEASGGLLQMEFFDTFDDGFSPQAVFLDGTITLQYELAALLEVAKTYRYTNVCFERDNDGDGQISEDGPDGIDNDDDGLIDEDASECPDGTYAGDEIANDGEGSYYVDSVLKKNGSVSSYNPGQLYAVLSVNVLADIGNLQLDEWYAACTDDPPDLLDLNPINGGGRAKVVVEHEDGTLEQVFDANVDDPDVVFSSDESATSVTWLNDFSEGDVVHLYVKFGPGKNSTGDGSCDNEASAATTDDAGAVFGDVASATLYVTPKGD